MGKIYPSLPPSCYEVHTSCSAKATSKIPAITKAMMPPRNKNRVGSAACISGLAGSQSGGHGVTGARAPSSMPLPYPTHTAILPWKLTSE